MKASRIYYKIKILILSYKVETKAQLTLVKIVLCKTGIDLQLVPKK